MSLTRLDGHSIDEVLKKCPSFTEKDLIRRAAKNEIGLWVWFSDPPLTNPPCERGWLKVPPAALAEFLDSDHIDIDCFEKEDGEILQLRVDESPVVGMVYGYLCGEALGLDRENKSKTDRLEAGLIRIDKKELCLLEDDFTKIKGAEALRRNMNYGLERARARNRQPLIQPMANTAINNSYQGSVGQYPLGNHSVAGKEIQNCQDPVVNTGKKIFGMKRICGYLGLTEGNRSTVIRWNDKNRLSNGTKFLLKIRTGRLYAHSDDLDYIKKKVNSQKIKKETQSPPR